MQTSRCRATGFLMSIPSDTTWVRRGRQIANLIGLGAALAAIVYLAFRLQGQMAAEAMFLLTQHVWSIALLSVAYAAISFIPCLSWALLLGGADRRTVAEASVLCARTQIFKYLPGNILHFAARHTAREELGSHRRIAMATWCDLVLAGGAAAFLALVGGLPELTASQAALHISANEFAVGAAAIGIGVLAGTVLVLRWSGATREQLPYALLCWLGYLLFFGLCGLLISLLLSEAGSSAPLFQCVVIAALAWIFGTIIPGASAGLGIRELVIVTLATPYAGPAVAGFVALAYRLVTLGGDALLGLTSRLVRQKIRRGESHG